MLTIAGSGPSVAQYATPVTVATKKRPCPSDYVMVRFGFQANRIQTSGTALKGDTPIMVYYKRHEGRVDNPWYCDSHKWDEYWKQFIRMKRPPQRVKPSLGTCAVFACVERWNPTEIGLIGFDNILDGNDQWEHDAIAEKRCIESLVKIIDLRQGS